VGAGLSGLTLARSLKYRGLSATIYERDTAQRFASRHGYGITLWAYQPLINILGYNDSRELQSRVAVDAEIGGTGHIGDGHASLSVRPFRANRQRLERVLSDGLDIRWGHKLQSIRSDAAETSGKAVQLRFENAHEVDANLVIGADGVHSQVRKIVAPSARFDILPYAVYNGKRKVPRSTFEQDFAPHLGASTTAEQNIGDVTLKLSIDEYKGEQVYISYTYSRPSRAEDQLFRPERPMSGAEDIPSALFDEVRSLRDLKKPFDSVFRADQMKNDRLLNWLMRSVAVYSAELDRVAEQGIILLGDSIHGGPILGGDGANVAIEDAVELAKCLETSNSVDMTEFYSTRTQRWTKYLRESGDRLADMHLQPASRL
jgi:2-polyprenyl-6-methoxyphenol hydroxylase-like FAD-dependent oxidoreductase